MISNLEHTALEFLKHSTSSLKALIIFGGIVYMFSTGYCIQLQLVGSFSFFILALHDASDAETSLCRPVGRGALSRLKSWQVSYIWECFSAPTPHRGRVRFLCIQNHASFS